MLDPTKRLHSVEEHTKEWQSIVGPKQAEVFGLRSSIQERIALGISYVSKDRLYDTISVAAGAAIPAQLQFFVNPATNGKTYSQTNLDIAQQLSNNDMAWISGIYIKPLFNIAPADAANLESLCWADILLKKQRFVYGKIGMFPGGSAGHVNSVGSLGTAVALAGLGPVTSYTNGSPNKANIFDIGDDGYLLWKNDSFTINLNNTTPFNLLAAANGGTGLTLEVGFDITRVREVVQ
jgi:hypothetical protein